MAQYNISPPDEELVSWQSKSSETPVQETVIPNSHKPSQERVETFSLNYQRVVLWVPQHNSYFPTTV